LFIKPLHLPIEVRHNTNGFKPAVPRLAAAGPATSRFSKLKHVDTEQGGMLYYLSRASYEKVRDMVIARIHS
jgi:hypothetical protein